MLWLKVSRGTTPRNKFLYPSLFYMKILVAGSGFIGSKIIEELEEDHEVKTLDRTEADFTQDITEEFELDESFDVIFHTVGLAPGMNKPEAYERVHIEGTKNILEGVECDKIVYISALKSGEVDHSFFKTKQKAEDLIKSDGRKYTVVRPSTVYGRGNKLMDMIRKASPLRIFPDIRTETQPIHIDDLQEILGRSVQDFDNEILEVAGHEVMTVGEMAKKIYRDEGFKCFLLPVPRVLQETGLKLSPFSGPFSSENIQILRHQNTVEENDAEEILERLRSI